MISVFVKAILCNWMVCLAVVAAMTTSSTIGKIACAYMPVFIFGSSRNRVGEFGV
jgi:formate/nitrite transporter FocA (FNT family)